MQGLSVIAVRSKHSITCLILNSSKIVLILKRLISKFKCSAKGNFRLPSKKLYFTQAQHDIQAPGES